MDFHQIKVHCQHLNIRNGYDSPQALILTDSVCVIILQRCFLQMFLLAGPGVLISTFSLGVLVVVSTQTRIIPSDF